MSCPVRPRPPTHDAPAPRRAPALAPSLLALAPLRLRASASAASRPGHHRAPVPRLSRRRPARRARRRDPAARRRPASLRSRQARPPGHRVPRHGAGFRRWAERSSLGLGHRQRGRRDHPLRRGGRPRRSTAGGSAIESRYGRVGAKVQGSQWMMQWVRQGRMLRLTWRTERGERTASVSLVDGRVLDAWGRDSARQPHRSRTRKLPSDPPARSPRTTAPSSRSRRSSVRTRVRIGAPPPARPRPVITRTTPPGAPSPGPGETARRWRPPRAPSGRADRGLPLGPPIGPVQHPRSLRVVRNLHFLALRAAPLGFD